MKTSLGIELGSTRIKATLINDKYEVLAQGTYTWESRLINGYWTFNLDQVKQGCRSAYQAMLADYKKKHKKHLTKIDAMGVSAMMHGYLAFDKRHNLLVPFRTWRNTTNQEATKRLTKLFNFNIPQRYSIAHLYQAILNNEFHVKQVAHLTTLAGYVHYCLTGQNVLGIGDASGMFPIDSGKKCYSQSKIEKFDKLIKGKYKWKLIDLLPKIKLAGDNAGQLTEDGKKWLGATNLRNKPVFCPPEGDAGTGMVSTNAVANSTGNISAGTSAFAMIVTNRKLAVHPEIDMVTTPDGTPAAMVHTNNCSSDINAWTKLFEQVLDVCGVKYEHHDFMTKLFNQAELANKDGNGITIYNYYSGEDITKLSNGKPIVVREPDANFNLPNFMRVQIMTSIATLKLGMDILTKKEGVVVNHINAHGGMFKAKGVTQRILAAALNTPISLLSNSSEGGSYGIAILAMYSLTKGKNETLVDFLDNKVYADAQYNIIKPEKECVDGYVRFMERYIKYLKLEKEAIK